jgi:hypothetical protein
LNTRSDLISTWLQPGGYESTGLFRFNGFLQETVETVNRRVLHITGLKAGANESAPRVHITASHTTTTLILQPTSLVWTAQLLGRDRFLRQKWRLPQEESGYLKVLTQFTS